MAEEEAGGHMAAELSEAARRELLDQCEEQFDMLQELQDKMVLHETKISKDPQEQGQDESIPVYIGKRQEKQLEQSVKRLIATDAELKQWLSVEPQLLPGNSEILLQAGKEEMHKLCSELELIVVYYQARAERLRKSKECEQKWLEEKQQALQALNDHVERIKVEKNKLPETSAWDDTKEKLGKMKTYNEKLMESLGYALEKIPFPDGDPNKEKNLSPEMNGEFITINEILERLMNKFLETPHDPYVMIEDTFWPPYTEMLLRYGIAVRHSENNFKIRLETFY